MKFEKIGGNVKKYWKIVVDWFTMLASKITARIEKIRGWFKRDKTEPVVAPSSQTVQPAGNVPPPNTPPPSPLTNDGGEEPDPEIGERWKFYISMIILNALVFITGVFVIVVGKISSDLRGWVVVGETILSLQLLFNLASLRIVNESRLAILLVFGKYATRAEPGLVYAPPLISQLVSVTKKVTERDLPDDPKFIFYKDPAETDGKIPEGFVSPIRVTFIGKELEKDLDVKWKGQTIGKIVKNDPFLVRQTAAIEISYGFRVVNLRTLYVTIGSIDEALESMDDHTIGGFASRLQKMTLAEAMFLFEELAKEIKETLSEYSRGWGIEVTFVRIKPFGFSHAFNTALAEAAAAIEEKKKVVRKSEGERDKRRNEGIGDGAAAFYVREGIADGQEELAEVTATEAGRLVSMTDAARDIAKYRNFAVVDNNNVIGGILGMREVWNRIGGNSSPSAVTTMDQPEGQMVRNRPNPSPSQEDRTARKDRKRKKWSEK